MSDKFNFKKGDVVVAKDDFLNPGETLKDTLGVVVSYNPDNDYLVIGEIFKGNHFFNHTFSARGEFYRLVTSKELKEFGLTEKKKMPNIKGLVNSIMEGKSVRQAIEEASDADSSYEIPDEYKEHYSGKFGEFDYDIREFKFKNGSLKYIGKETDGRKIKIPNGIEYCIAMFSGCKSLTKAPEIPNGVKYCSSMFHRCSSLTKAPEIPNGVKDCETMFYGCESLTKAPVIPSSVTDCRAMFSGCKSLTKAPEIPASVEICRYMFKGCPEEVQKAGKWNIEHRGKSYYDYNKVSSSDSKNKSKSGLKNNLEIKSKKDSISFEVYSEPDYSLDDEGWAYCEPHVDIYVDGKKFDYSTDGYTQPVIVTCYPGSTIIFSDRTFSYDKWKWVNSGAYSFVVPDGAKGKAEFCVKVSDVMHMDVSSTIDASRCKGWAKDVV